MTPHSPGTDQIDTLLWIGFVAAAIVVVAINVALFYAVRRYRAERGAEPRQLDGGRRIQFRVGAALTVFAAAILVLSVVFTDKARETPTTGAAGLASAHSEPLTIKATGQQWLWRYDYPNGAFSYYKLVVPVDTAVDLDLVSTDVDPHLGRARPGRQARRGPRQAQPGRLPGRRRRHLQRPGGDPLRPGLRGDADRGRSRLPAGLRSLHRSSRRAEIQAAQDRVVGLIENGEVP